MRADPEKVAAINNFPKPTNVKELRRFVGMANFLHHFVERFSVTAAPLVEMVTVAEKNGSKVLLWTEGGVRAFAAIKADIMRAPGLFIPDLKKQFRVVCDASGLGMGSSLWQRDPAIDGKWRPVAFMSMKYPEAVRNYSPQERELFAVIMSFKKWRHYLRLVAVPTLVISDHESLATFVTDPQGYALGRKWEKA